MAAEFTVDSFLALRSAYEMLGKVAGHGPEQTRNYENLETKVFACARYLADNRADVETMVWLCRQKMQGTARTQINPEKLREYLTYAQERGHVEGTRLLARYYFGWDRIFSPVQIDRPRAMSLFETAATSGDTESRYEYAVAMLENEGGQKDEKKARSILQSLMCESYPPAFFTYYTSFYLMSDREEDDKAKHAYETLRQGIEAVEHAPAMPDMLWVAERLYYFAALALAEGYGCEKDLEQAIILMKRSAEFMPGGEAYLWLYNKGLDRLVEIPPLAFPANPQTPPPSSYMDDGQASDGPVLYAGGDEFEDEAESDPTCIVLEKPLTFIKFSNEKIREGDQKVEEAKTELTMEDLDSILQPFDSLIGLDNVRDQIKSLFYLMLADSRRRKSGLVSAEDYRPALHMVFSGNPGTGKTTVARLTGEILKKLGYLKRGHVVEVDRSKLVGEYIGQSEHITAEILKRARDGVLFVDEAYDLEVPDSYRDYGHHIIAMIMKAMEDNRNNMVVIFAGFKDEMKWFIQSNAGLSSRIGAYIDFPDYSEEELAGIFEVFCKNHAYSLSKEAKEKVTGVLKTMEPARKDKFGNARGTRNMFDETVRNQSRRIIERHILEGPDLTLILPEDVPGKYVPGDTGGKIAKFPPRK